MASATDLKDHPAMNIHPVEQFVTERVSTWREEAAQLKKRGLREAASLMESLADELESTAEASLEEMLTLAEAAETSGYSYSTLRGWCGGGKSPTPERKAVHVFGDAIYLGGRPTSLRPSLPSREKHTPISGRTNSSRRSC